jgi:hypothetical protein
MEVRHQNDFVIANVVLTAIFVATFRTFANVGLNYTVHHLLLAFLAEEVLKSVSFGKFYLYLYRLALLLNEFNCLLISHTPQKTVFKLTNVSNAVIQLTLPLEGLKISHSTRGFLCPFLHECIAIEGGFEFIESDLIEIGG